MYLFSSSLHRRYRAPTCGLEVRATLPPLCRWTPKPTPTALQFQLDLEASPGHPQLQLQGDRQQLEALAIAVTEYIQQWLVQAPAALPLGVPQAHSTLAETATPIPEPPAEITLRSQTLLWHQLLLGNLATAASGPILPLSTTQLFDLSTVLEAGVTDLDRLPSRPQQMQHWVQKTPIWTRSAAIVVVLVGLTSGALQLTQRFNPALGPTSSLSQTPNLPSSAPVPLGEPPPPPPGATTIPAPPPATPPIATSPSEAVPPANPEAVPLQIQPLPGPELPITNIPAPAPLPPIPPPAFEPAPPPQEQSEDAVAPAAPEETNQTPGVEERVAIQPQVQSPPAPQTALARMPQVGEIRSYFAQRWQPPAALKQSLEYTLILNPDGSLQRAIPLDKTAGIYLDRTPIPLANEPFVSPLPGPGQSRIRLVLGPDGKVQSFLESTN